MSKGLYQFFSILAPVIYLVVSVLNMDTSMNGFSYWIISTFITEMLLWTLFILEYEWVPEQKRSKKCKK